MGFRRGLPWQLAMAHAIRLVVWLKHVKTSLSLSLASSLVSIVSQIYIFTTLTTDHRVNYSVA